MLMQCLDRITIWCTTLRGLDALDFNNWSLSCPRRLLGFLFPSILLCRFLSLISSLFAFFLLLFFIRDFNGYFIFQFLFRLRVRCIFNFPLKLNLDALIIVFLLYNYIFLLLNLTSLDPYIFTFNLADFFHNMLVY